MSSKVLLAGHCGPDASYLKMVIKKAAPHAKILSADDSIELQSALDKGVDMILFNRQLEYGFDEPSGIEMIRRLKETRPQLKIMLVSNFPEAQQAAAAAGALPGFGKRELGSPHVLELLRAALAADTDVVAAP